MKKVYLVGGAVRDELLGRPVKDHDWVVVGATPEEMLADGFEQVGADFPVFLHPETKEEYALARQERKTGSGYHGFETHYDPSVTLEDDLVRRDLTINAMARDQETGELIDPYNGLKDLRDGVLRHVSEAFAEDPLRVLRVARFNARYDFSVAPETVELMKQLVQAGELDHLTPERVWTELEKSIMEDKPTLFFRTLDVCGAKEVLFPEIGRSLFYSGRALMASALRNANRLIRLMILFAFVNPEDAERLFERLKAPLDIRDLSRKINCVIAALFERPTAEQLLELLKQIDAFRQPNDVFRISAALDLINVIEDWKINTFLEAAREAKRVTFATLSEEQQKTLKGKEVGDAIDAVRLERITAVL